LLDNFDVNAAELLGAHILVGITRLDRAGRVAEQRQFHGHVVRASRGEGFVIVNAFGEELRLPPDGMAFAPADPGEYRLRSTGEVVVDPDYTATWTITPPAHH
jgi:hypothetical protein